MNTPKATSFCTVVQELQPPQANPESNPLLACNAVNMDNKDEETPAPDPHDGGSMRGEKMAFIPSRSPDVEPSATIFNAGPRHEAEEARPRRGRTQTAG